MAISKSHLVVPPEKFSNAGVSVPRLAIKSDITLVDLMSLLTGNTKAGYTSAGVAAGNVALASATPSRRDGSGNYCEWSLTTDAGEYFLHTFATAQNLSAYNFLSLWMYSDKNLSLIPVMV